MWPIVLILLLLLLPLLPLLQAQFYNISSATWEQEYSSSKWAYIKNVPVERARNALISTFVDTYGGVDSMNKKEREKEREKGSSPPSQKAVLSVLDVGCGEGVFQDFMSKDRNSFYVGVDLSTTAIDNAKRSRGKGLPAQAVFIAANADKFTPEDYSSYGVPVQFDVIVFNEVLYYAEHKKMMQRYKGFLKPHGVVIISCFFKQNVNTIKDVIIADANAVFRRPVDEFTLHGLTSKKPGWKKTPVSFQVNVYRN